MAFINGWCVVLTLGRFVGPKNGFDMDDDSPMGFRLGVVRNDDSGPNPTQAQVTIPKDVSTLHRVEKGRVSSTHQALCMLPTTPPSLMCVISWPRPFLLP